MRLALVGVSHRQAPVELRERVAVDADGAAALAVELALGCEAVVLSTCNRTELYLASEDAGDHLDERASASLLALAGSDGAALAPVLYRLGDDSAALARSSRWSLASSLARYSSVRLHVERTTAS